MTLGAMILRRGGQRWNIDRLPARDQSLCVVHRQSACLSRADFTVMAGDAERSAGLQGRVIEADNRDAAVLQRGPCRRAHHSSQVARVGQRGANPGNASRHTKTPSADTSVAGLQRRLADKISLAEVHHGPKTGSKRRDGSIKV